MRSNRYNILAEINVTNLVDVILVLLIIFMITAPLLRTGVQVNLPQSRMKEMSPQEAVIVTLTKEGALYVDRQAVSRGDFTKVLSQMTVAFPGRPVLLQADQEVPYGRVIEVMDGIKSLGIERVGLVLQPVREK